VTITDDAITAAVMLSVRYIQDRFLPDKAIDLLDEACAKENNYISFNSQKIKNLRNKIKQISKDESNAINNREYELASNLKELERIYVSEMNDELISGEELCRSRTVNGDSIRSVLTELYGIDNFIGTPGSDVGIAERLSEHVLGQAEATRALAAAITRSSIGLCDERRPRGVFLFIGESGVGKTELGRAMSRELFHSDDALIRYDMSEFAEAYSVSKLLGSAPGYVGYDETNSALERVRKHPYSVVLLDEIEKAHPDVLSLFLQIFDNGFLTDATGRRISFRNAYIVMTSNIGADRFRGRSHAGFLTGGDTEDMREMLREYFKPEFINRIDEVVLFSALEENTLAAIADKMLSEITRRLSRVGITLSYSDDVTHQLASEALESRGFGARPLSRLITSEIENPIADILVAEGIHAGDTASACVLDGRICVAVGHPDEVYSGEA
jgi:ATP-dependent Clp protease ATP-binding subunit ClpC